MRKIFALALVLMAALAWSACPALAAEKKIDPFTASFAEMDRDSDGVITVTEVVSVFPQGGTELHRLLDQDKDGKVTQKEWEAWRKKYGDQKPMATAVRYVEIDTDADGNVVANEFIAVFGPGSKEIFDKADKNKDGKLSKEEFEALKKK